MTALCGGGTSGPKPAVAAVVDYSSGLIASILAARGLGWLIPVIPLAGLPPLVLANFCGSDPPALPTFTSAETSAIIGLQFGSDFDSGVSKLKDLILHSLWYDACQCTSGSLTAFPTITPPAGTPITLPPLPNATVPCDTKASTNLTWGPGSGTIFPKITDYRAMNVTMFRVTTVNSVFSGTGPAESISFKQYGTDFTTVLRTDVFAVSHAQTSVQYFPALPGTGAFDYQTTWNATTGLTLSQTTVDAFCNGDAPGGVQQPCCPPDLATQASLDLILQTVTLIQRQAVPFGYVPSTVHAGLSGAGVIPIAGLIGAKVAVTTLPTQLGRAGSTPVEYFDMGFLTFGTPDGYPTSYRLERDSQLMLPSRCAAYTDLAYDLHPGVVVTITELLREP